MKILLCHTYNRGYLSGFFHEVAIRLLDQGHEVVSFSWKASISEQIIDGVKVIIKKKKGYLTNYLNIYSIIKKEKPDVILSNFSYVNPALLFGKLLGVSRNIVWFHSLNAQMRSSKKQIFVKKHFLKLADVVVANSYLTKKELYKYYNISQTKIQTIPFWSNISENKVQPSDLKHVTNKNVIKIGCPGRIEAHKNQKIIIETLSKLKETSNFVFHLYFAGTGEDFSNLTKEVTIFELTNEVTFLKHLSANDMLHFYKSMDVVVLPSLHEAFGLVFIEAISLGTPVIVSSQFGALSFLKESEKEFYKFTFNPESANDLLKKLVPYFKNEGLSKDFFKKLYFENFDKEIIFKKFLETIKPE